MPSCGLIPLYKALAERHADWQLLRYAFCGVKLSDLSLRGGPNGAVAISQNPAESRESDRRKRNCLSEIAPQGHFLALRAQGATSGKRELHQRPLLQHPVEKIKNRHQSGFFRSNFSFSVAFAEKIRYDGR